MKCKDCDIEIDVKLTYCVSCAGGKKIDDKVNCLISDCKEMAWHICHRDKGESFGFCKKHSRKYKQMKEFDLRPFEVGKKKEKIYEISKFSADGSKVNINTVNVGFIYEEVNKEISNLHSFEKLTIQISEYKGKNWQWEDIEVGWFFKCDGTLFNKTERSYGLAMFDLEGEKLMPINFAYSEEQFKKYFGPITNVYDCPELAKTLMIEKILT